ncbi:MAG: GlxA family transcriptional regulator [Proteobacteria bacterium]|nr:GlxA family transcriptional regulator [Pseudomonadota bacterium]
MSTVALPSVQADVIPERRSRVVVLFAYDECQSLDVTGPLEVFSIANRYCEPGHLPYRIVIVSCAGGPIRSNSGLQIADTTAIADAPPDVDTVLVVGGSECGRERTAREPEVLEWLRGTSHQVRRYGSVCTGAFLLGAAGLLDGRRVTTHWNSCAELSAMYPAASVIANAIYVEDGPLYTSAGITAAMDLALLLVEADLGRKVALQVARHLVVFLRRSGGQSQFSTMLAAQARASHRLRDLLTWIAENPKGDLRVSELAARVNMSERNFTRRFRNDTGMTPAEFVESARLDRARQLLEETDWPVCKLAQQSGFGSVDGLERTFVRRLETTPREYRRRFTR